MIHSIYNSSLDTTLIIDETECENTLLQIEVEGRYLGHYLDMNDLENLIHVLKYVLNKKNEINPNYGKRVSALSLKSVELANKLRKEY